MHAVPQGAWDNTLHYTQLGCALFL